MTGGYGCRIYFGPELAPTKGQGHSDFNYNIRPRPHDLVLTAKGSPLMDKDFITRIIFKDIIYFSYGLLVLFNIVRFIFSHPSYVLIFLCLTPGPVSTGMGDRIGVRLPVREMYLGLTNQGQLSLDIPPRVGAASAVRIATGK